MSHSVEFMLRRRRIFNTQHVDFCINIWCYIMDQSSCVRMKRKRRADLERNGWYSRKMLITNNVARIRDSCSENVSVKEDRRFIREYWSWKRVNKIWKLSTEKKNFYLGRTFFTSFMISLIRLQKQICLDKSFFLWVYFWSLKIFIKISTI